MKKRRTYGILAQGCDEISLPYGQNQALKQTF